MILTGEIGGERSGKEYNLKICLRIGNALSAEQEKGCLSALQTTQISLFQGYLFLE